MDKYELLDYQRLVRALKNITLVQVGSDGYKGAVTEMKIIAEIALLEVGE